MPSRRRLPVSGSGSVRNRVVKSVTPPVSRSKISSASERNHQDVFYAGPVLVLVLVSIVGQLLYLFWSDLSLVWKIAAHIGVVLCVLGIGGGAYVTTRKRDFRTRLYTFVTIGLGGLWLELCSITGLFHLTRPYVERPTLDLLVIGGLSVVGAWMIRLNDHANLVKDHEARDSVVDSANPWEALGLSGVRMALTQVSPFKSEGTLTVPKAFSVSAIQGMKEEVERFHGFPPKSLTIVPDSKRHGVAKVSVLWKDPLAGKVNWPGLSLSRRSSPFDLIPTGVDENGNTAGLYLVDEAGTKHHLVTGMTGSGKSEAEKPVTLYAAAVGVDTIILDPVKGIQTFGSLAPALKGFIIDERLAKEFLNKLEKTVIKARTDHLGREGLGSWSTKSSLNLLRIHIEEAWKLMDTDALVGIALAARSAGIQLVLSVQRASHDMLPTSVRDQLGTRRMFGTQGSYQFLIMDDELVDAGADPTKWKNDFPGMHYMDRAGLTVAQKATPIRAYTDLETKEKYSDVALAVASKLSPPDRVTIEAFGSVWEKMGVPTEVVQAASSLTPGGVTRSALNNLSVPSSGAEGSVGVVAAAQNTSSAGSHPAARGNTVVLERPPSLIRNATGGDEEENQETGSVTYTDDAIIFNRPGLEPLEVKFTGFSRRDPNDPDDKDDSYLFVGKTLDDLPPLTEAQASKRLGQLAEGAASSEELERQIRAELDELRAKNQGVIKVKDHFEGVMNNTKRSRASVYQVLNQMVQDGTLEKDWENYGYRFPV